MNDDREHNLVDAFDERWDDYRKQFKAGRQEISEDSIHDLRVSARRMEALLGIVRGLNGRKRLKKLRRFLSKQLDELDNLRDTQVMLQEAESSIGSLPQLIIFRDELQRRLDDLVGDGRKDLHKAKPSDLKPRIKKIRKVVRRHSDDPDHTQHVLQAVDAAYAKTLARFGRLDAGNPNSIHRVRIAFKKLRYMIEAVQAFLPDYPKDYPAKMHDYQDAMGKVHDTDVFLDTLKEFELDLQQRSKNGQQDFDLKPVEVDFRTRLANLILAYFQRKDELHTFWRAAPGEPFPWEKSHDSVHRTTRNRRTAGPKQQRGAGQPAASHRRRKEKVPANRAGTGQPGNSDRPDPDQPVPTGG